MQHPRAPLILVGLAFLVSGCVPSAPQQQTDIPPASQGVFVSSSSSSSSAAGIVPLTLRAPDGSAHALQVEIADTPALREYGLMNRTSLPQDSGMLFVFPSAQPLTFWMKNTLLPLDVIFFTADGSFLSVSTMTPCPPVEEHCPLYPSAGPASYALEVGSGEAARWGVGEGWRMEGVMGASQE